MKSLLLGLLLGSAVAHAYYSNEAEPEHLSWNLTEPQELIVSYPTACDCP